HPLWQRPRLRHRRRLRALHAAQRARAPRRVSTLRGPRDGPHQRLGGPRVPIRRRPRRRHRQRHGALPLSARPRRLAPDKAMQQAELYALLHQGTPGEVEFYRGVCAHVAEVLELGVGAGRIAGALARDGVRVVGVEQDAAMIAIGRAENPKAKIEWVTADMRSLNLGRRFERVLLPYNGLYTLASDADVVAC